MDINGNTHFHYGPIFPKCLTQDICIPRFSSSNSYQFRNSQSTITLSVIYQPIIVQEVGKEMTELRPLIAVPCYSFKKNGS